MLACRSRNSDSLQTSEVLAQCLSRDPAILGFVGALALIREFRKRGPVTYVDSKQHGYYYKDTHKRTRNL